MKNVILADARARVAFAPFSNVPFLIRAATMKHFSKNAPLYAAATVAAFVALGFVGRSASQDREAPRVLERSPSVVPFSNFRTISIPTIRPLETRASSGIEIVGGSDYEIEFEWSVGANGSEKAEADEFPLADAPDAAPEDALSAECSAWARFAPGSWARSRTTSVAYENGKENRSVTENRILLKKVDFERKFYELQFDATIKMAGVDRPCESKTARFDFWDVPNDGDVKVETLAPINLMIARKAIPCQTRRLTRTTSNWKETTTLWFSPVVAPYVLQKETRRESLTSGDAASLSRELSVVQKTAANLLIGRNFSSYFTLSSTSDGRGVVSKTTEYSVATPGGIVRETIVETDESGKTLYRSTTVLLDYYVANETRFP